MKDRRSLFALVLGLPFTSINSRTLADDAFVPTPPPSQIWSLNNADNTRGWSFHPFLAPGQQLVITAIGVFDPGGDGLAGAHEVGLWGLSPGQPLLASTVVPAGTSAPLINGYRYASLSPVIPLPSGFAVVGAHFAANDPDDVARPENGVLSPLITGPAGILSAPGSGFSIPTMVISRGEGEGLAQFFEVNFQFKLIPEPSTCMLLLFGVATAGVARYGGTVWERPGRGERHRAGPKRESHVHETRFFRR